jgi:hypothetical protein
MPVRNLPDMYPTGLPVRKIMLADRPNLRRTPGSRFTKQKAAFNLPYPLRYLER